MNIGLVLRKERANVNYVKSNTPRFSVMPIIASCGHTLTDEEDIGWSVSIKDYDREGEHAVTYQTLCRACLFDYLGENLILHTEKDEEEWIDD